jgi:hypothetical protein
MQPCSRLAPRVGRHSPGACPTGSLERELVRRSSEEGCASEQRVEELGRTTATACKRMRRRSKGCRTARPRRSGPGAEEPVRRRRALGE